MNNNTMVSIIIPACNNESTIEYCIESVYKNNTAIECIVVINNSTDLTEQVLSNIQCNYPSLHIIKSEVCGVSEARNEGLKQANGNIIGFCDADDYYEKNAIDAVVEKFDEYSVDIVITGIYRTLLKSGEMKRIRCSVTNHDKIIDVKKTQGLVLNHPYVMGSVCNKFYRKSILHSIEFDKELTHCEDMHFNMQLLKKKDLKILLSNIISYNYLDNPYSVTRTNDNCFTKDNKLKYLTAIEKIKNENSNSSYVKNETSYTMARLCIENYHSDLSSERKKELRERIARYYVYLLFKPFKYRMSRSIKHLIKGALIVLYII